MPALLLPTLQRRHVPSRRTTIGSLRALHVLIVCAAACFLAPPAQAGIVEIDNPADNAILNAAPSVYDGTGSPAAITAVFVDITRTSPLPVTYLGFVSGGLTFGTGTWSAAGPALSDGEYDLVATQSVPFVGTETDTAHITIDSQPPDTTILTTPANPTNSTNAPFTFDGDDPSPSSGIDRFECKLDTALLFTTCASGDSFTVTEGLRTFEVRAVDAAGNADPTPASYTWMVDTTDPNITIPKQRILLHDPIALSFSCTDPVSNGVTSGIDTCTDDNPTNNEDLGPHQFTVTAVDNAGNDATATGVYTVDPSNYGDFVQDDDPIGYWRLNDAVGADEMTDSSGNGNDGEYKNGIALGRDGAINCARRPHPPRVCETADEPENKAAFFPERDGYGAVQGIPAPTTAYTMEAWVKPRSTGAMMIMGHGGNAGQLFINENQRLAFRQVQDTVSSPGPNIPLGAWTHVAGTWDGTTTRLYVNGVEVATSTTANGTPSGLGTTFYVGYGEQAPWFHGDLDEMAYYDHALSAHRIADRYKIGTAVDGPSLVAGNSPQNTEGPFTDPIAPRNGAVYAPGKTPNASFSCSDPDDVPGNSDVASCTATVNGNPIANGAALPSTIGNYSFVVTAVDEGGNTYVHTHTYEVKPFSHIMGHDTPIAYYRLGDGIGAATMDAQYGPDGEYKNKQDSSPTGISGDGDSARSFDGDGGYGFVNGITAPKYQTTIAAWVHPDDVNRDQSIVGHGDAGEIYLEGGVYKFRHGPQNRVVSSSPPYAANPNSSYTHVVATWDGVDLRIYVNGVLEGQTESGRRVSSASTFYVGYGEIKPWFDGRIDEVAYYDRALSANRVFQHFLADPAPADAVPEGGGDGGGAGGGGGGGGGGDAPADNGPAVTVNTPLESQGTGGGGNEESVDEPTDEKGEETSADLSGTWQRADGSVLELTRKGKGWIGKTVLAASRKAGKSKKARAAGKKRCGLKKGVNTIAIKQGKDGTYKGEILDPVTTGPKNKKKCVARKASFTGELDGDSLTLAKKRGKGTSTEVLTRTQG